MDFNSFAPDSEDVALIDKSDWLVKEGEETAAVIAPVTEDHSEHIELYNSGAMCHISPYKSDFSNYSVLDPPVFLNAANQQKFPTIGVGSLAIQAPNGSVESTLTLANILHVPAVGYTLVSLSALDKKGYRASIGGRTLDLFAPGGERITCIPQSARGLYHITHTTKSANAVETVSVMELHWCMGHITPTSARALIKKGLITGIKLDPDSREVQCKAYIFVHATCKPVLKTHVGPQDQYFREEVHTDVWGPSPVASKRGCYGTMHGLLLYGYYSC